MRNRVNSMGCDIHLYAEVKREGKWYTLDKWTTNEDGEKEVSMGWKKGETDDRFYTGGRNYSLFCALAGVRKYQFSGNPPIASKPKGVRKDHCPEILEVINQWGSDGHSHSYLTLKQLIDFDYSSYGETCDAFFQEVIPKMEAANVKPSHVRIVFFFDN